jgi:signal transduction histidine kinase
MNYLTCLDTSTPNLFNIFDTTIAPPLLFYAYIPIIFVSLFLSIFVLIKDKYSLLSKLLFIISILFSILILNEVNTWIAVPVSLIYFSWQLVIFFEVSLFILCFYFVYVFLNKKDLAFRYKILLSLFLLPTIVFLSTSFNISYFDINECGGDYGYLWEYNYIFQFSSIVIMMYMFFDKFKALKKGDPFRKQILIMAAGVFIFLTNYALLGFYGDLTLFYDVNLIGPLGMLLFLAFLSYMIVKFKTFHIKLLAPQVLVVALIFLNFAILFVRQIENVRIIVFFTIAISVILGFIMIRAVKKVDEQREALDIANKQQENLLHFISHQVKGFFTKSRNAFSGLLEGDYGPLPDTARHIIQEGFDSDNRGVETVQQILSAANLKTGETAYTMTDTNIVNIIKDAILLLKPNADKKSLALNFNPEVQNLILKVDAVQMGQALKNLIDNSIKYTPAGKIDITLEVQENNLKAGKNNKKTAQASKNVVIKVSDTGVGISAEDMPRLFSEGGRGVDSIKVNVDSTGYGLYIVKNIIEAHGGSVTVHSDGVGKGSVFTVVLPIK